MVGDTVHAVGNNDALAVAMNVPGLFFLSSSDCLFVAGVQLAPVSVTWLQRSTLAVQNAYCFLNLRRDKL